MHYIVAYGRVFLGAEGGVGAAANEGDNEVREFCSQEGSEARLAAEQRSQCKGAHGGEL